MAPGLLAGYNFLKTGAVAQPVLMTRRAEDQLGQLAQAANVVYFFEMSASVASVYTSRQELIGRKLAMLMDCEAACAAATKGTDKN